MAMQSGLGLSKILIIAGAGTSLSLSLSQSNMHNHFLHLTHVDLISLCSLVQVTPAPSSSRTVNYPICSARSRYAFIITPFTCSSIPIDPLFFLLFFFFFFPSFNSYAKIVELRCSSKIKFAFTVSNHCTAVLKLRRLCVH